MKHVGRPLSAAVLTIGVTVAATGCGTNVIGADGPRPGLAAQVDDTEISLDDLNHAVDGLCTLIAAAGDQRPPTSREYAQAQLLQGWVIALVDAEYAADQELEVNPPDPGLESLPGWDEVDEEDREPLASYVDAAQYSATVREQAADAEAPDPADYDISINPRFDVELDGAEFVPAGDQLSVPVSDEAAVGVEEPSPETLEELPDDELCGERPDPQVAAPPIPMG